MAPQPLNRGCYCSVSLRTCTITLATIYLLYALLVDVLGTLLLEIAVAGSSPESAIGDDFEDSNSSELEQDRPLRHGRSDDEGEDFHHDPSFSDEQRVFIIMTVIFGIACLLLSILNVIFLTVLIIGAVMRKASLIRPWLWVGAAATINDIIVFIVFVAVGVHFEFVIGPLLDTPLAVWLWIVAWSLYEDCRSAERRNASCPSVGMAALLEEGDAKDAIDCSVAYSPLGHG